MNKYSSVIRDILSYHPEDYSKNCIAGAFCTLEDKCGIQLHWDYGINHPVTALVDSYDLKLSWLYLLSIVDQATADEMIQMMCEPYSPSL